MYIDFCVLNVVKCCLNGVSFPGLGLLQSIKSIKSDEVNYGKLYYRRAK